MINKSTLFNHLANSSLDELVDIVGHKVPFPKKDKLSRNRIFNQWRIFWLFLSQVLCATQSCREALRKAQAWIYLKHNKIISSNTSAYCQARSRIKNSYLNEINNKVVESFDKKSCQNHLWLGRKVKVVDGSSVSMPDTKENQKLYPQPYGQKKGCGIRVMRIVAMFSLATGALIAFRKGSLNVHERRLWHKMIKHLEKEDVVLADRGFCSLADYWILLQLKVDCVMRLHQRRSKGVKIIKKLGKNDSIVEWKKTQICPKWLTKEEWKTVPASLIVRHVEVNIEIPGFRTRNIIIATTLTDHKNYTKQALADLYRRRWLAELFLRDLKTSMHMDILRCKTPELVHKEITISIIAYNLIRALIWEAAVKKNIDPYRISFSGTISTIRQWAPLLATLRNTQEKKNAIGALFDFIAKDIIPYRPNRQQPRAIKRRKKNYQLLTKPRWEFMEIPHRHQYKKSLS